uniref:Uncharacterized protein n=1 Tax=Oryza brachyantha TaxID=4533 RepID=J3L0N9_ORYBR
MVNLTWMYIDGYNLNVVHALSRLKRIGGAQVSTLRLTAYARSVHGLMGLLSISAPFDGGNNRRSSFWRFAALVDIRQVEAKHNDLAAHAEAVQSELEELSHLSLGGLAGGARGGPADGGLGDASGEVRMSERFTKAWARHRHGKDGDGLVGVLFRCFLGEVMLTGF